MRKKPAHPNKPLLYAGIILVLVILAYSVYLFVGSLSLQFQAVSEENSEVLDNITQMPEEISVEQCFLSNNFSSPLFIYRKNCPYSKQAYPMVQQLTDEGYSITFVDADNLDDLARVSSCTNIRNVVPQYVCIKDGSVLEGLVSIDEIRAFYDSCLAK